MYSSERDPYCYTDSDVLKNKANLRTAQDLEQFETAMTFARAEEPLPSGRFSIRHYCSVHHHLFQDVYVWAGRYRTIRLAKGESMFCYPENIPTEMKRLFAWLKAERPIIGRPASEFAQASAHFLAELNAIHPFREGNGRTQLAFLAMLASHAGHPLDLDRLQPEATLDAMIGSFQGDEAPLRKLIATWIA